MQVEFKPTGTLINNCVHNYTNGSNVDRIIYQGYSKSFDKTLSDMVTKASTMKEDVRNLGGGIISNQLRVDSNLSTDSKEIVGAINEVNDKVKFVSTFKDVEGLREQLYYLTVDDDEFTDQNGNPKHYRRGLYIYNENTVDPSLNDFKLVSGASGGVPVGTVVAYSGKATAAPEGFLWCNGAKYNKLIYPELYQAIGETYTPAAEKGGTTFRVPDLTDKIPWQSGSLSGSKAVGSEIAAGIPNITGSFSVRPINNILNPATGVFTRAFIFEHNNNGITTGGGQFLGDLGEMIYTLDARRQNSTYGNSNTVQPPAIAMRFMIRYTADEEKAKEVFDFSEEVKRQLAQSLMTEEIKKTICEKSYPVGSVYQNYSDARDPKDILGCGEWRDLGVWNSYAFHLGVRHSNLKNVMGIDTYTFPISGSTPLTFSSSCLPNITGGVKNIELREASLFVDTVLSGAFYKSDCCYRYARAEVYGEQLYYSTMNFDASRSNSIYKSSCKRVMPDTIWVYTWVRKS